MRLKNELLNEQTLNIRGLYVFPKEIKKFLFFLNDLLKKVVYNIKGIFAVYNKSEDMKIG